MADQPEPSVIEELRCELAEKAREISELDVMLADYQEERDRLIRELRALQARLRDILEQTTSNEKSKSEPGKENNPT